MTALLIITVIFSGVSLAGAFLAHAYMLRTKRLIARRKEIEEKGNRVPANSRPLRYTRAREDR